MAAEKVIAELARTLAVSLEGYEEGVARARAAARQLAMLEAEAAARVIAALVARAGNPVPREVAAIAAVGKAIADAESGLDYEGRVAIYGAANELGLEEVKALFIAPPAQRAWREPFDKADPKLAHLTLGHKKALARGQRDPDLLARLAAEGEPPVVRELLHNSQLTEAFVVRIAARRPCRPETLRCIYEHRRWRTQPAIALALARNPFVETEIALKLLPTLNVRDLRDIARDGTLHPTVRESAERLRTQRRR